MAIITKTIGDTFLYGKFPAYDKALMHFILKAERINTKGPEFEDILYDIKRRRISDSLSKVLTSSNTVLAINDAPLPKCFKAFVAKDLNDKSKPKVFIDGTEYIKLVNGNYDCTDLNWLISFTISGITSFIYKIKPEALLLDQSMNVDGGECFMRCLSYVIDRLFKITSVPQLKKKVDYAICLYYQFNLLEKDFTSESQFRQATYMAKKISMIPDKDAEVVNIMLQPNDFTNIDIFAKALERMFTLKNISIDMIVATWMQAFGTGTQFALEFFPLFATMLTHAYIGGYLNNQVLIEKLCESSLVLFSKSILKIGDSCA